MRHQQVRFAARQRRDPDIAARYERDLRAVRRHRRFDAVGRHGGLCAQRRRQAREAAPGGQFGESHARNCDTKRPALPLPLGGDPQVRQQQRERHPLRTNRQHAVRQGQQDARIFGLLHGVQHHEAQREVQDSER